MMFSTKGIIVSRGDNILFSEVAYFYILDKRSNIPGIFFNVAFNDRYFTIFLIYWRIRKNYTEFMQLMIVKLCFFKSDTLSELLMYTVNNNIY